MNKMKIFIRYIKYIITAHYYFPKKETLMLGSSLCKRIRYKDSSSTKWSLRFLLKLFVLILDTYQYGIKSLSPCYFSNSHKSHIIKTRKTNNQCSFFLFRSACIPIQLWFLSFGHYICPTTLMDFKFSTIMSLLFLTNFPNNTSA